jgi:hypothetical protein
MVLPMEASMQFSGSPSRLALIWLELGQSHSSDFHAPHPPFIGIAPANSGQMQSPWPGMESLDVHAFPKSHDEGARSKHGGKFYSSKYIFVIRPGFSLAEEFH